MQTKLKWFEVWACAVLAAACAGQPRTVTPAGQGPVPAVAVPSGDGGTAASGGAPTTVSAVNVALVKEGYKVQQRNDKLLYCRPEIVTGTMFKSLVCLTERQIENQKRAAKENQDTINQQHQVHCLAQECTR